MPVVKSYSGFREKSFHRIENLKIEIEEISKNSSDGFIVRVRKDHIGALQKKIDVHLNDLEKSLPISQHEPYRLAPEHRIRGNKSYIVYEWVYQDSLYEITGNTHYTDDEQKLLILEFVDKERQKFERLKNKFSNGIADEVKFERMNIPESVRIAVWRRDIGKCAKCGSRENLEYDHIVPVSRGGSNTERNVELLCQNCNRSKSNRIG